MSTADLSARAISLPSVAAVHEGVDFPTTPVLTVPEWDESAAHGSADASSAAHRSADVSVDVRPVADVHGGVEVQGTVFWRIPVVYPVVIHLSVILGLGAMSAILPTVVAGPLGQELMGNGGYVNFAATFVSLQGGLAFVTSGFIGRLSDTIGRKPLLVFTASMLGVPPLLFVVVGADSLAGLWTFQIATFLAVGLTGGDGGPVGPAFLADAVPPADRPAAFAWLFILAPCILEALSIPVNKLGVAAGGLDGSIITLLFAVFASVAGVALVLVLPKENLQSAPEDETGEVLSLWRIPNPIAPLIEAFQDPPLRWLCLVAGLMTVAESLPRSATLYVYLNTELGIDSHSPADQEKQQHLRLNVAMITVFSVVPVGILIPSLLKCMSKQRLLLVTIVLATVATASPAVVAAVPSIPFSTVLIGLMGGAFTAPGIPVTALVSEAALSPELVGSALGAMNAAKSLMNIVSSPAQAAVFNVFNKADLAWMTFVMFAGVGAVALIPAALFQQTYAPVPQSSTTPEPGPGFCKVVQKTVMSSARAVTYNILQFFLAMLSFVVVVVLACLSIVLLPLAGAGLPIVAMLLKAVDACANADLAFGNWLAPSTLRRPARTPLTQLSLQHLLSWLRTNLKDSTFWLSLFYFAVIKLPIEMLVFFTGLSWAGNSLALFFNPMVFIVGSQLGFSDWCFHPIGPEYKLDGSCNGVDIDSVPKSLLATVPGAALLALGAFLAKALARFSLLHSRFFQQAKVNELLAQLSSPIVDGDGDYWGAEIDRPRLSSWGTKLTRPRATLPARRPPSSVPVACGDPGASTHPDGTRSSRGTMSWS